jgi:hypothetical protein
VKYLVAGLVLACTCLYARNCDLILREQWAFEQLRRISGAVPAILDLPLEGGRTFKDEVVQSKIAAVHVDDGTVVCALAKNPDGWGTTW